MGRSCHTNALQHLPGHALGYRAPPPRGLAVRPVPPSPPDELEPEPLDDPIPAELPVPEPDDPVLRGDGGATSRVEEEPPVDPRV